MKHLHVDIETYSEVDIKQAGAYKYAESDSFEIIMLAYALDGAPVRCFDFKDVPPEFWIMLQDPDIIKVAHNAAFERICFEAIGYSVPVEQWRCTAIKSLYSGLPMSLAGVSDVLQLGDKGKLASGKRLIKYFCTPCRPTKVNKGRTRNLPEHAPEKWDEFKKYCINDVEAERAIAHRLAPIKMPHSEWEAYFLDQRINDRGVRIDTELAAAAVEVDTENKTKLLNRVKYLTGCENPNSLAQLRDWIEVRTGQKVKSLAKGVINSVILSTDCEAVKEVLRLRQRTSKTSVTKYQKMQSCVCDDGRARGLLQFYGAGRTGRWAGRLIQVQNLPRNKNIPLVEARRDLKKRDLDYFELMYPVSDALSQLIRTALIPTQGRSFIAADFSAIEARVLAWLAGEHWRLEVFASHGKIYEASASRMFSVPLEQIGPDSELRAKGKVAELALGYQGAIGALQAMGGEAMGLDEDDMAEIVAVWRKSNPRTVQLWWDLNSMAVDAVKKGRHGVHPRTGLEMRYCSKSATLQVRLPSGRSLVYQSPTIVKNRFGREAVQYWGVDSTTKQWAKQSLYGGKIVENITQAVARDLLLYSMHRLEDEGHEIVVHVHDEAVIDTPRPEALDEVLQIMSERPEWAESLPLAADGWAGDFYKK